MSRSIDAIKQDMARDTNIRQQDKQRRLEETFITQLKSLQDAIEQTKRVGEEQCSTIRTAQLQRLSDLITRKSAIEAELTTLTTDLAKNYVTAKAEFDVICQGRIQDMQDCEKVLQEDREEGLQEETQLDEDKHDGRVLGRVAVEDGGDGTGGKAEEGNKAGKTKGKATDIGGLIREVPGKEAVKRAEEMARRGERV